MNGSLTNYVFEESLKYLDQMPKKKRKEIGQFFTSIETAQFMAGMFAPPSKERLNILDPGAGSGILTAAIVERLQNETVVKNIKVTCYETNEDVMPILEKNLEYIKEYSSVAVEYEIVDKNYITSQKDAFQRDEPTNQFDWIICNPPYRKIMKNADEAVSMPIVCYGAPNMYFLFAAMGLFNMASQGEMVFIIPRSWTSGAYFKRFRKYLLGRGELKHIHLFISRDKVFEKERVLQETIIVKLDKATYHNPIRITCSNSNSDFDSLTVFEAPYDSIVVGDEKYVYLTTNVDELSVLQCVNRWDKTLPMIGLRMRTGLTVDFRCVDYLRNVPSTGTVPLFYAQHIKNGRVSFPIRREWQYITTDKSGLIQKNKNYLFVKRFTSKEENRRLQCGIYQAQTLPQYDNISTQNKINFIEGVGFDLSVEQVYGLYVIFNSTLYDRYYRILNGSTQVNSTEINNMPVPSLEDIQYLGMELIKRNDLSVEVCDNLLGGLIYEHDRRCKRVS